ncbi:MAG TPA: hypothetical protein EYP53_03980 [Candidatus Latescibacteria bacterium]|nr:hypothetical protein [Candidatus Latescibacterota bacterium]
MSFVIVLRFLLVIFFVAFIPRDLLKVGAFSSWIASLQPLGDLLRGSGRGISPLGCGSTIGNCLYPMGNYLYSTWQG